MTIISVKIGNSSTVRKNNTVKSPLIAQNLHQQAVATATRITLKAVVGTHHLLHFSFFHQSFERRKISFIQITGLDIFRIKLMAVPFRTGVYGKVLGTSMQLVIFSIVRALQTLYNHHPHTAGQIRVFPISLYTPSPARVAVDVHRRRPHCQSLIAFMAFLGCIVGILGTGLIRNSSKYLVYSLRRERCRHTNRLGKHCGQPGTRHSMQRFIPPVIGLDAQTFHWFGAVHHQGHLLFERQFLQQKSGTLFCRQRCILVSSLPASRQ